MRGRRHRRTRTTPTFAGVQPQWWMGAHRVTIETRSGTFSPWVDGVGLGYAPKLARGVVVLHLDDRNGVRAVLPWWIRTAGPICLRWCHTQMTGESAWARRDLVHGRTAVWVACSDPALACLHAEVAGLPDGLEDLLTDPEPPARLVLRDYALSYGLHSLSSAL